MEDINNCKSAIKLLREIGGKQAFIYNILRPTIVFLEQRLNFLQKAKNIYDNRIEI